MLFIVRMYVQVSARSMRLRCMETLMSTMDDDEVREAAGASCSVMHVI